MRKLSRAEFHSSIFAPSKTGASVNIGRNLPSEQKRFTELDMSWTPEGMIVKINSPSHNILNCEIIVPWANVVWAQFLTESKKDADASLA